MVAASSLRIVSVYPETLMAIGSPKGAKCVISTSEPGKQPISNNFNESSASVKPIISARSPIFKSANVLRVFKSTYLELFKIRSNVLSIFDLKNDTQ